MTYTLIEYVKYRIVFVESYFKSGFSLERNVSEDDAKADWNKQQWFEVFFNGQPYEEYAGSNHDDVTYFGICESRIGNEIIKIALNKIYKSHGS